MLLYWLLVSLMVIGVIGAVVPAIPGISLIIVAIVIWGAVNGFATVSLPLGIAIVVLLLSIGVDLLATYWGAKQAGASSWGVWGAMIGLTLGFLGLLPALPLGGPLLGIILGAFLGAMVGELLYQRDLRLAAKAALGVVVGSLVGNLIQGILALGVVSIFLVTTWPVAAS